MQQVDKEHYKFIDYVNDERWMTYYYQISEIVKSNSKKILYCGVGDGIVVDCVRKLQGNVEIDTFDVSEDLSPDVLGDLTKIAEVIPKEKYDCIVCCQILEHIPFDKFEDIIKQLKYCCRKNGRLIISLPDRSMKLRILLQVPALIKTRKLICIPRFWQKRIEFKGEHYWEAGNRGYMKNKILSILSRYFTILTSYNVYESPCHWFIIMKSE